MRLTEAEYARWLRRGPDGTMTEAQLMARLKAVMTRMGYFFYHSYSSKRSTPGYPDCCIVHPTGDTTCYMLELKRDGESPTLAQQRWLDALTRVTQVEAQVLMPSGLEAFVARLKEPR